MYPSQVLKDIGQMVARLMVSKRPFEAGAKAGVAATTVR